ncbi:MAG: L-threonylcarbamoyladenylate synthase [Fervidicoccaceae archaeon]
MTRLYKVDPHDPDPRAVSECANLIRAGGLVAFPTETVYGLGANAYDIGAVLRVYEVKRRPLDNPLIVHIASADQLLEVARSAPEQALRLVERAWPGPLTLVLPRNPRVPRETTGGLDSVAVRVPAHPVALALIKEAGVPIAAPSANVSGRPSPTEASHVVEDLWGLIDAIIDGGETLFGVESTVVSFLTDPPILLRPGSLPIEEIERILGREIIVPPFARGIEEAREALSPGVKYRHYAPSCRLVLVELKSYDDLKKLAEVVKGVAARFSSERRLILATDETVKFYEGLGVNVKSLGPRSNLYRVAQNLFKALREADKLGVDVVIAEGFEERGLGLTLMSRLRKASTSRLVAD